MFRKLVSHLSLSPALVGQLGFYARRLHKEEVSRRAGLIFVALALVIQGFAIFDPAQSANASNPGDLVQGGLGIGSARSLNKFLKPYDANVDHLKDIYTYAGITRKEIVATTYGTFTVGTKYSLSHQPRFSYAQGERTLAIANTSGTIVDHVYTRPLALANGANATIYGYIGHSAKAGWFAIMQACGNLVLKKVPPPPPAPPKKCVYNQTILADSKDCAPCPGNSQLWVGDSTCVPNIQETKSAINLSQGGVNATSVTAQGGDRINYTLTIKNTGLAPKTVTLQDNLSDVVEYATLVDNGGGTYDSTSHVLSWPNISLSPGKSQTRSFGIQIMSPVPATAQGQSDPTSYDCRIDNVFGNTVEVNIACPTPKTVEQVTTSLPHTGPGENMLFAGIVLSVVTYFYARARQVRKEVHVIRKNMTTGAL